MYPNTRLAAVLIAGSGLGWPLLAQSELLEDSHASLELRNFYFNRDFRQSGARDKAEEWAQGFLLRMESGYTEGTIGVGADAIGLLGVKLDSGDGTAGTGLLPADQTGGSQDEYSKLGLTAKLKASNSVLKVGALHFKSPIVSANDSRLLPQLFRGALLNVQEIDDLTLQGGRLDRIKLNSSSDYQEFSANRIGGQSDTFNFGGGDYRVSPALTASLHYGQLEDIYRQTFAGLVHTLPLGEQLSLRSDLRYAISREDGSFRDLDNKASGALFTLKAGGHGLGAGYQRMSGDDPFPYIAGSDPFLVNFVQIGDFANTGERSWQLRYDYDFAALGVPGLTFMSRYVSGDHVERASGSDGEEWERNTDIAYVIQSGPLKNLGVKWRNATVRSNFANDLDENRLILSYSLALW
ncbi:OprD family porin [Metapseudomonas lalkuanensis]|uniref:OprD family porin n=1 Tax=Metapseudomonas lalkuanensis TaxID=2604832 RepID=A0A5J6QPX4_9GAMM|nr:OprD family porin [Pseudomonas lalkuanensis]QEY62679.1 OprD family porin [Pseudomonas lalkuanensis]UCO96093.1 OprD family porin [Pseudomonas lalkuanensis]